jgi:hypothetical protein
VYQAYLSIMHNENRTCSMANAVVSWWNCVDILDNKITVSLPSERTLVQEHLLVSRSHSLRSDSIFKMYGVVGQSWVKCSLQWSENETVFCPFDTKFDERYHVYIEWTLLLITWSISMSAMFSRVFCQWNYFGMLDTKFHERYNV